MPAKPDALAAAACLLVERIRLLSLSKPPRCSAAAPSHPVFRCHYLNTLLIRPWSTEVCSHWSSAHSTWDIYMTLFAGRGHERHDSLLESSCWNLPAVCGTTLHKRMTKSWEKLHVEQIKASLLHSFQALATGDAAALHLQPALQLVSHGQQQTPGEAACPKIRTKKKKKKGQSLLLLHFHYITCMPCFFFW